MLSQDFVVGPIPVERAINIELGTVGLLLRKSEIVAVLSPGRYSRYRLAKLGIFPASLSLFIVRTALTRFTTDCTNVQLGESTVDLRIVVQARLRLIGDLAFFFHSIISTYGTDFGTQAPVILQQLIVESLQETSKRKSTASTRTFRANVTKAMEPHEVFEIVDVVSITVTRDDPITVQAEVEERLRGLDRARRLEEIKLAAEEGVLRAAGVMQLSAYLGLDPLYLWDPEAYQTRERDQREAMVQLLGQYGNNLAVLAEATNMNLGVLDSLLAPVLPQKPSSPQLETNSPVRNIVGASMGVRPSLAIDEAATMLVGNNSTKLLGGVVRTFSSIDETIEIALLVTLVRDLEVIAETIQSASQSGTIVGVFNGEQSTIALIKEIVCWVTGLSQSSLQISQVGGQIVWVIPESLIADNEVALFVVETICDLFMTPPLIPVSVNEEINE